MMHAARRFAFVATALALASTPALAEDGPVTHTDQLVVVTPNPPVVITQTPGAPGQPVMPVAQATSAPQNEDWNNVHHINGTPVKAGERGEYLKRFRKTNIATNPIGFLTGFYNISVSHAVHENVAVRFDANLFHNEDLNGHELGIGLPIYLRRAYSGPFIEPGLVTRTLRDSYECWDGPCMDSAQTSAGPQMLIGWHWSFDSGLNMAIAAGALRNMNGDDDANDYDNDEDVEFNGYFRVGYAF